MKDDFTFRHSGAPHRGYAGRMGGRMSDVIYHRCDMCGDLVVDETNMGFFQGTMWLG